MAKKGGYEETQDKVLKELGDVVPSIGGRPLMRGEVRQYGDGPPKVSIFRVLGQNQDKRRQELRLRPDDLVAIARWVVLNEEMLAGFVREATSDTED